jgi:hypothetical protein
MDLSADAPGRAHRRGRAELFLRQTALVASEDHKMSLFSWNDALNVVQQLTGFGVMVVN